MKVILSFVLLSLSSQDKSTMAPPPQWSEETGSSRDPQKGYSPTPSQNWLSRRENCTHCSQGRENPQLASKHTLHIQQNCATVHFWKWESNSWSNYIHALSDISLWGQSIIQGRRGIDSNGRLEFEKLTWGLEGIELINPRTEGTTEWVVNDYDDLQVIRVPMETGPNLLSLRRAGKCLRRWAVWRSKELVLAT